MISHDNSGNLGGTPRAFSILELLVAITISATILLVVLSLTRTMVDAWRASRSKVQAFQDARLAFDRVNRTLGQATLNTYYDYFDSAGRSPTEPGYTTPARYGRQSELHFIAGKSLVTNQVTHASFFQTPIGHASEANHQRLGSLLNSCGFYLTRDKDVLRPGFLTNIPSTSANPTRYRLMHFLQPAEQMGVYAKTGKTWFTDALSSPATPVEQIAENIVALVILPRRSSADAGAPLTQDFNYDSRSGKGTVPQPETQHQLPPAVEVIMVAVDEPSADRMERESIQLPGGLFEVPGELEANLDELVDFLESWRLTYRVFRTVIPLSNAKWSSP